jgi:anthranilate synthase component 2/para-aminobenzoate synthetase component 2
MILVVDNYDSFVHNVTRYLRELGAEAKTVRNDEIASDRLEPGIKGIVISPGPCTPKEAGVSLDLIRNLAGRVPILGICLGHQCIGEAFGGVVTRARRPMHGEASAISHYGAGVLNGIPDGFNAGRYHSLIVELDVRHETPLIITARSEDGEIMGLEHRVLPVFGVQFHPESVLTEHGHDILRNFLRICH